MSQANYRSVLITPQTSIRETFQRMNDTALMIALVTDPDRKLLGTVTDGDIRRGLLKGLGLDAPVEKVMNTDPVAILSGTSRQEILTIMNLRRIGQIPLVDAEKRVVGLELLTDLLQNPEKVTTPVVIFAGGYGKRLRPLTSNVPKPMLPVGGRPLIELIVGRLARQGFYDFHLAVHYKEEVIQKCIGDGDRFGVRVQYIHENEPLGTVGAVRLVKDKLKEAVLMINGDVLTSANFHHMLKFHKLGGQQMTIGLKNYSYQIPYGVVKLKGEMVVGLEEKPMQANFVSAGIYVVNPPLLDLIPEKKPFDMPDFIRTALSQNQSVAGYPIHEYWLDIGSPQDYEQANISFDENFGKEKNLGKEKGG